MEVSEHTTYAIVLTEPKTSNSIRILTLLTEQLGCTPDQAKVLMEHAPSILFRDLAPLKAESLIYRLKTCECCVKAVEDQYADTPESAMAAPEIDLLTPPPTPSKPKEPMGFGMTLLAVMLGVLSALFLRDILALLALYL